MVCAICNHVIHETENENWNYVFENDTMNDSEVVVCSECCESVIRCARCRKLFVNKNNSRRTEREYCNKCKLERDICEHYDGSKVHDYGLKPTPIFRGGIPSENVLTMGIELEMAEAEDEAKVNTFAESIDNYETYGKSFFYGKDDCSLNDYGIEVVSHPATLEFHKSTDMWRKMLDEAKDAGLKSNDTDCCGIHIHVNKNYFNAEQINKLDAIVNRLSRTFRRFARRNCREYARYSPDKRLEQLGHNDNGRYSSLNISIKTIEFRIFKGNMKYESIMALFELVQGTCDFVKQDNIDIQFFFQDRNIINRTFKEYLESRNFEYLPRYTEMCRVWRDLDNEENTVENN